MINKLRSWLARSIAPRPAKQERLRSAYDAAQTGIDSDHWAWADSLNGNAANSPGVRRTLRERARYECENNGYAFRLIDKLSKDMVGSVPRLQLTIPNAYREHSRAIEKAFKSWAKRVSLGEKLRLLDAMAIRDGEGFATLGNNPDLDGVQLDLKLFEGDQVTTPFINWADLKAFDGGMLDDYGNVVEWHFLKAHPGSNLWLSAFTAIDKIPAKNVIQWFRPTRAGQLRGVPEVKSSLSLYAYLRRYTLATVSNAENAASICGVMETDVPLDPQTGQPVEIAMMDQVPMPRGSLLTVPRGSSPKGFDPTHPTTTYPQFKGELLTECGAPVGAPRNVATGSSAEYNYSSGRLDYGIYQDGIKVRRHDFGVRVLDRIFRAWLDEACEIPNLIPAGLPPYFQWSWEWFFDGFASIDPVKDANADDIRLKNGTTTYAEIYAENGQDWEEQFRQLAAQIEVARKLGILDIITGGTAKPLPTEPVSPEEAAANA